MSGKASRYVLSIGAMLLLLLLSGCAPWEWLKEKLGMGKKEEVPVAVKTRQEEMPPTPVVPPKTQKDTVQPIKLRGKDDKVLVTMKGVPVMTLESFKEEFKQLTEDNPQLKALVEANAIPDLKYNILNQLITKLIIDTYVEEKKLNQKPEYLKDLERITAAIKQQLNITHFMQEFPVTVTDSEVKKFYEENKDKVHGLVVSYGGVRAVGIKFEKEDAAKAFYEKVKGKSKEFDSIAKKEQLGDKIQDFKLVNDQSIGINPTLRSKILTLKKLPAVELISLPDKKEFWVVNATEKEEKQYRPYDEVKEFLKEQLKGQKEMKNLEEVIEKLKKDYNVIINEEVAKVLRPAPEEKVEAIAARDEKELEREKSVNQQKKEKTTVPVRTAKVA